ncbi:MULTISPECIES: carboxypeptidase regulatory-like domain-containing protein [Pseudonocardia]|uniref:Cna protein B-type domain protein n=2 Tax=Pseudonocardia TaxID=1847 RepID=A0A1Y2MJC5_PSEAH|nr:MULTISPECIES: carboxypeptidase regulatory-like domain-containing protein [Pseudonocardia]OSY35364.1 hypothetical protein BG845_06125 [Pseudonocardia autotrophica]TDN75470.1 carboxypeptidase family protein [Pseudonocardia autotrophica]BBF99436.1 hypothetical protein Pdca_06460 [Pseudonocardia autotrophica]GEC28522.1 hypothetical protein PSA01_55510 [Pseudonocardia saturnea]
MSTWALLGLLVVVLVAVGIAAFLRWGRGRDDNPTSHDDEARPRTVADLVDRRARGLDDDVPAPEPAVEHAGEPEFPEPAPADPVAEDTEPEDAEPEDADPTGPIEAGGTAAVAESDAVAGTTADPDDPEPVGREVPRSELGSLGVAVSSAPDITDAAADTAEDETTDRIPEVRSAEPRITPDVSAGPVGPPWSRGFKDGKPVEPVDPPTAPTRPVPSPTPIARRRPIERPRTDSDVLGPDSSAPDISTPDRGVAAPTAGGLASIAAFRAARGERPGPDGAAPVRPAASAGLPVDEDLIQEHDAGQDPNAPVPEVEVDAVTASRVRADDGVGAEPIDFGRGVQAAGAAGPDAGAASDGAAVLDDAAVSDEAAGSDEVASVGDAASGAVAAPVGDAAPAAGTAPVGEVVPVAAAAPMDGAAPGEDPAPGGDAALSAAAAPGHDAAPGEDTASGDDAAPGIGAGRIAALAGGAVAATATAAVVTAGRAGDGAGSTDEAAGSEPSEDTERSAQTDELSATPGGTEDPAEPTRAHGATEADRATGEIEPAPAAGETEPAPVAGETEPALATEDTEPALATGDTEPARTVGETELPAAAVASEEPEDTGAAVIAGAPTVLPVRSDPRSPVDPDLVKRVTAVPAERPIPRGQATPDTEREFREARDRITGQPNWSSRVPEQASASERIGSEARIASIGLAATGPRESGENPEPPPRPAPRLLRSTRPVAERPEPPPAADPVPPPATPAPEPEAPPTVRTAAVDPVNPAVQAGDRAEDVALTVRRSGPAPDAVVPGTAPQDVEIRVLGPDDAALPGAAVALRDRAGSPTGSAVTGADGIARIPAPGAGEFAVVARLDGHRPGVAAFSVADTAAAVTVRLRPSASVHGTVRTDDGAAADVPVALEQDGEPVAETRTGPDGTFRLTDLDPGRYRLVTGTGATASGVDVEVPAGGDVEQDVTAS